LIGYFVAILITIAIMFIFDHGQPALLYLVPGVLGATTYTAYVEKDLNTSQSAIFGGKLANHTEAFWIGNPEEGEEEKKVAEKVTKAD
jgi:hypothetical protein